MKMRKKKILLAIAGALVVGVLLFLYWPGHQYMRQALIHWYPKIDQYPIFENRTVRAATPQPWAVSSRYGTLKLSENRLADFEKYETVAFVVIHKDSLLFEQYWEGYGPQSHSNSFSMAKSIVSLLIGVAIDEGLIMSVKQPVNDFIPEFGAYNGKELTVEDLLTMSAGVEWDEGYSGLFSLTTEAYYGKDIVAQTRRIRQNAEPGVEFYYQSGVTQILALILETVTGKSLSDYASEKLWTPIGAEQDALWSLDHKDGFEKAYCCFNSNARDFARLGQLILNKGAWNGEQLVSADYITQATTPATWLTDKRGEPNREYGYQFWVLEYEGMTIPYFRGILGQGIFVIPDKDAVIVRLGHKRSEERFAPWYYPSDIDVWLGAGLELIK